MRRVLLVLAALGGAVPGVNAASPSPGPAERIVVLAPHLAEITFAAGAGERLVGAVEWSDYPPAARDLPRVGDAFSIDDERVAALAPDLVIAWSGGTPAGVIRRLAERGFRVETLATSRLADVAEQILVVGGWAGTLPEAQAAAQTYRTGLEALRADQAGKAPVRVFYQVSARPLYTVGADQVITQVISLCGGENVFSDLGQLAAVVDLEAVVARDPQAILAPSRSPLDDWQRWPDLAAVRLGNLFSIDGDLIARPSPRLLQGARQICARLDVARARLRPPRPDR